MILVCAATRTERDAVKEGIHASGATAFEVLLSGVGPTHAARALEERLARGTVDLVVSTGFAGTTDRAMARMSWVTARSLRDVDGVTLREAPAPASACEIVTASELVEVAQKSERGVAIDMESAALARVASAHGASFMVLRLVSDTPDQPLPSFLSPFANAMASDDTRSRLRLAAKGLGAALRDPRGVATLVRDGRDWSKALREGWAIFARAIATK